MRILQSAKPPSPRSLCVRLLAVAAIIAAPVSGSLRATPVSVEELTEQWAFYGQGEAKQFRQMLYLGEAGDSKGAMVVSPEALPRDYRVRFDVLPLSAATVVVLYGSILPDGKQGSDPVPAGYDGDLVALFDVTEGLFAAFHNAAHSRTPFVARVGPKKSFEMLGEFGEPVMWTGRWSRVEFVKEGRDVRLAIDGEPVVEARTDTELSPGLFSFRVRGTAGEPASCLIRDVRIETTQDTE